MKGSEATAPRPHVLLLSEDDDFSYIVLRAARASGARVSVLARERGRWLRLSRLADRVHGTAARFDPECPQAMIARIERLVRDQAIDIIAPGNAATTRFLCAVKDRLSVPTLAIPELDLFDRLNDKWRFAALLEIHGLARPSTRLFLDRNALRSAMAGGELAGDGIVKPLSRAGGVGVHRISPEHAAAVIDGIDYAPILWQRFVPGPTFGASAYCLGGQIVTFLIYSLRQGVYAFHDDAAVRAEAALIVNRTGFSGLVNFDLIAAAEGHVWLECNPRVFFSIDAQAAAGANFMSAALALDPQARRRAVSRFEQARAGLVGGRVRKLSASIQALARGERLTARDLRLAAHQLSDPVFFAWNQWKKLNRWWRGKNPPRGREGRLDSGAGRPHGDGGKTGKAPTS